MLQYIIALLFFGLAGIILYYLRLSLTHEHIKSPSKMYLLGHELKFNIRRANNPVWYWGSIIINIVVLILLVVFGWNVLKYNSPFSLLPARTSEPFTVGTILGGLFFLAISILSFWTCLDAWRHGTLEFIGVLKQVVEKKEAPLWFWFLFVALLLFGFYVLLLALRILGIV